jgi:hypothetical protein
MLTGFPWAKCCGEADTAWYQRLSPHCAVRRSVHALRCMDTALDEHPDLRKERKRTKEGAKRGSERE